ncbi:MAG: hypothetical protein ACI9N0_000355 [Ilumatobacter sp.]|jgi:hypothetical protein
MWRPVVGLIHPWIAAECLTVQMKRSLILCTTAALLVAGCSFSTGTSPADAAVDLIEGPLSEQSGLKYTGVTCTEPAANEPGETFTCKATAAAGGPVVMFDGLVEADEKIFVSPTNIIDATEMSVVEAEAADALGGEVGTTIDPSDVNCPGETTVLVDDQMRCEITDVDTGDRYEMIVTATDFVLREGYGSRFYEIGALIE